MTNEKTEDTGKTKGPKDRFQEEFEALPLDEKFAKLFKMEAATISEAFSYAVNSPMKVVEKVGDAISDLGVKLENEIRKASKSREACDPGAAKGPSAKPKSGPKRKSPPRAPKA